MVGPLLSRGRKVIEQRDEEKKHGEMKSEREKQEQKATK